MLLFDLGDETFPSASLLFLGISSVIFLGGDALVWLRTQPRRVQGTNTAELQNMLWKVFLETGPFDRYTLSRPSIYFLGKRINQIGVRRP